MLPTSLKVLSPKLIALAIRLASSDRKGACKSSRDEVLGPLLQYPTTTTLEIYQTATEAMALLASDRRSLDDEIEKEFQHSLKPPAAYLLRYCKHMSK